MKPNRTGLILCALVAAVAIASAVSPDLFHLGHVAGYMLAAVPLVASPEKSRVANEFRAQADALRGKIADPAQSLNKTELETALEGIRTLEARAAAVADFTPRAEIERQGGDDEVRRANPDAADATFDAVDFRSTIEDISKDVVKFFGGPNRYLLRLAQRSKQAYTFNSKQGKVHERLQALQARAVIGTDNDASGGEFLLPLSQVASIFQVDVGQPSFFDYSTLYPVAGRSLRIPYAVQTDATKTRPLAGIANVGIEGEGDQIDDKTVAFNQRVLTAYKIAAYTELGDETLSDDFTGDLAPSVGRMIGGQTKNYLAELCSYDGSGSSQPLGAFHANNTALIVVNRKTSQSIDIDDVFAMYAKHTFGMGRSAWFCNRTVIPELMALTLGSNTLVTWIQNLNAAPTMALLGLPVIPTDMAPVLGVKGDLALGNGGFYAAAIRQALSVESSIHYKFQNGLTAYRFITRGGGIPIPTSTYAYKSPSGTKVAPHSPFVVLGDDITS